MTDRSKTIPFNRTGFAGREQFYMAQAIENLHISGDGPFTTRCQQMLERLLGAPKALMTTSCTHALEMAAMLAGVQPGDEVILPSFTFVSTANAFALRGAKPIFADIRADTLNIDETRLERLITPATKCIVVVHYAGVGCEMDAICAIAARHGIGVIEDNAHGLFGRYKGKPLGTFGSMAAQSFHETKNISCGEGGAIILNDERLIGAAEIIREKGTNRTRFFRGQIDKYTWVSLGSSYLPSDLLSAFLYAQFEAYECIQAKRASIWTCYDSSLADWAAFNGVQVPYVPPYCDQSYHMYYLVLPTLEDRNALIAHLKVRNIESVFHYVPLHLSEQGLAYGGGSADCPVTVSTSDGLLRLPFFNELSMEDQNRVVRAVKEFNVRRRTPPKQSGSAPASTR